MCLIHNLNADTRISTGWLRNIYTKNPDGIGCMLFEDGKMIVKKVVPATFKRALRWYRREVEGRNGIVHWRYATHGDIDLDNAHPYKVLDQNEDGIEMWMMHNGVMDQFDSETTLEDVYMGTGRGAFQSRHWDWNRRGAVDRSRSDTYHMIRVLILPLVKPSLGGNPDNIHNPAVKALLNEYCGDSNKLVFMTSDGRTSIINEHAFRPWDAYGLHCSNGYAWASEHHKVDDPTELLTKRDTAAGDPRKFGRGTWGTPPGGYRPGTAVAALRTGTRNYGDADDDIIMGGHNEDGVEDAQDEQDALDAMPESMRNSLDAAVKFGSDAWDDLNLTCSKAAMELSITDIAAYVAMYGQNKYNMVAAMLAAGSMTDNEFVDSILATPATA